jgi:hypothetical protein
MYFVLGNVFAEATRILLAVNKEFARLSRLRHCRRDAPLNFQLEIPA